MRDENIDNLVNVSLVKVTSAGRWRIQGQLRNQSFPNTIKCLISSSGNVFPQLLVSCHFVCNRKEVHCFVNQQLTLTEFMPVHYKVGEVIYICVCSQDREDDIVRKVRFCLITWKECEEVQQQQGCCKHWYSSSVLFVWVFSNIEKIHSMFVWSDGDCGWNHLWMIVVIGPKQVFSLS